ncbi:MAG TPA: polysaccharide biosynthesis/export family protein [Bryobacteraceae bacterium]|nr:polysaccharide biosynthesis/export family protein [Bryobacteraceae bacterium]
MFARLFLGALLAAVCASGQKPTAPPPVTTPIETPRPMAASADNAGLAIDPKSFTLGIEDVVQIEVWGDERLSSVQVIRPDGKIAMKLIGEIQVAGLTPERLRETIKQAVSEIVQRPDVTIKVLQVNSRKFTLAGEVLRTGTFPLIAPIKVFDAVNMGGGFKDFANKGKIVIIRDGGKERLKFNYNDVLKGKHLEQNIFVQNGDTIYVH